MLCTFFCLLVCLGENKLRQITPCYMTKLHSKDNFESDFDSDLEKTPSARSFLCYMRHFLSADQLSFFTYLDINIFDCL